MSFYYHNFNFLSHNWGLVKHDLILSDGLKDGYGSTGHHGSLSVLRLIQLNTVNNWSDAETEAGPHGTWVTSSVQARGNGHRCERRLKSLTSSIYPTETLLFDWLMKWEIHRKKRWSGNKSWLQFKVRN